MLPETGHYTGTFRLASALRARGHRVVYLGLADFEEMVAGRGFEFVAFAADLLPRGYLASFAESLARPAAHGAWRWWWQRPPLAAGPLGRRPRREDEALFAAWLDRIDGGALDDAIASRRPDVVLCDPFVWYAGLHALRAGIRTLNLFIVLHHHANPCIPPVLTSMRPAKSALGSLAVRVAWRRMHAEFFVTKRLASRVAGAYRFPTRMHHLEDVFRAVARRAGFEPVEGRPRATADAGARLHTADSRTSSHARAHPASASMGRHERFDAADSRLTYWRGEMGPWLDLPAVVLCPRAFEFAGADVAGRCFAADVVDVDRAEAALDALRDLDDAPLVYASLGTSAHFYPHATRFFRAMAGVAARRPGWRVVVHVGDHADPAARGSGGRAGSAASIGDRAGGGVGNSASIGDALGAESALGVARPNLTVLRVARQFALLRRASVMVTHGGMNSILECVRFQVPMVIVPAMRDQPGNAARAVDHGIALTTRMSRVTARRLEALIDRALADATMRRALADLKRRIDAEPGLDAAVDFIEKHAPARDRSR